MLKVEKMHGLSMRHSGKSTHDAWDTYRPYKFGCGAKQVQSRYKAGANQVSNPNGCKVGATVNIAPRGNAGTKTFVPTLPHV